MSQFAYALGTRVICTSPFPKLDGLRGVVVRQYDHAVYGQCYDVNLDSGGRLTEVWESKLDLESEFPNYPLPE